MSLYGTFERSSLFGALASLSIIFSAAYTIYMYQRIAFGGTYSRIFTVTIPDVNKREFMILITLVVPTVFFGIYPAPILDGIQYSVSTLIYSFDFIDTSNIQYCSIFTGTISYNTPPQAGRWGTFNVQYDSNWLDNPQYVSSMLEAVKQQAIALRNQDPNGQITGKVGRLKFNRILWNNESDRVKMKAWLDLADIPHLPNLGSHTLTSQSIREINKLFYLIPVYIGEVPIISSFIRWIIYTLVSFINLEWAILISSLEPLFNIYRFYTLPRRIRKLLSIMQKFIIFIKNNGNFIILITFICLIIISLLLFMF